MLASSEASATQTTCPVVVVGSSAGGLGALIRILSGLPGDFEAPIVLVQHLAPGFPSRMAEVLCRHTQLAVKQAEQGDVLQRGVVFIAPPDHHVVVTPERTLALNQSDRVHFLRPSVDLLFSSACRNLGSAVIGVILSGTGSDGTAGTLEIKAAGGVVLAQDETTSEHFGMPGTAIRSGWVDKVLPIGEIAGELTCLVRERMAGCDRAIPTTLGADTAGVPGE